MGRFISRLTVGLLLISAVACGYRTAPVPYDQPDSTLTTVTQTSLNRRGQRWVFRWEIPPGQGLAAAGIPDETFAADAITDTDDATADSMDATADSMDATSDAPEAARQDLIQYFRIRIHKTGKNCAHCEPVVTGTFEIEPVSGEVEFTSEEEIESIPQNLRFLNQADSRFSLNLPLAFFEASDLIDRCHYTIDYLLESGIASAPSEPIYNFDLNPVPLPSISFRTGEYDIRPSQASWFETYLSRLIERLLSEPAFETTENAVFGRTGDGSGKLLLMPRRNGQSTEMIGRDIDRFSHVCLKPVLERFLMLEWEPLQETVRHTLQKDGKIAETAVVYGLNLYRQQRTPEAQDDGEDIESEVLINPAPLLYGRFSLLNFQGRLSARHVDRFGNESEAVRVFDGRY